MSKTTSLALATLLVVAVAGSAAPTFAQDYNAPGERMMFRHHDEDGPRLRVHRMHRGGAEGGLLALVCSDRGADRLEHMLLSIAQRTDVTATQQPLFDALQSAAVKAQADFAAACTAARPAEGERGSLDLADRLNMRLEIQKAHVAALETLVPAFTAFYDSLSDEQKAALEPRGREHRRDFGAIPNEPGMMYGPELGAPEELPELIGLIDG
jgi:hypothetical protein